MIMKKYVKPETLKVNLSEDLCGGGSGGDGSGEGSTTTGKICGVTTYFNVSAKEKTTYEFCYHYPTSGKGTKQDPYKWSSSDAALICIKPGHGVTFLEEGTLTASGTSYTGWADFKGSNGLCHFAGRIAVDGNEVTKDNASVYKCK